MFFASRWHNAKQRKVLHVAHTTTRCFTRRNALLAHILDMEHKGADQ
jgi:hypothetical protein